MQPGEGRSASRPFEPDLCFDDFPLSQPTYLSFTTHGLNSSQGVIGCGPTPDKQYLWILLIIRGDVKVVYQFSLE